MDTLKLLFPYSFKNKKSVGDLILVIILHLVVDVLAGALISIFAKSGLPGVSILASVAGSIVGIYATAGIVLAILHYVKVIKD